MINAIHAIKCSLEFLFNFRLKFPQLIRFQFCYNLNKGTLSGSFFTQKERLLLKYGYLFYNIEQQATVTRKTTRTAELHGSLHGSL